MFILTSSIEKSREVGGLFFDDLNYWPFEKCFNFLKMWAELFWLLFRNCKKTARNGLNKEHRDFQQYRRGDMSNLT